MPKVSILIISYNRDKYVSEAVNSVLSQTFKDLEIIFVDDCSADNTFSIINSYTKKGAPIIYKKNEINLGITKSRNIALSLCSGKYVAILDSDDIWLDKNKLVKQIEFLDKNKEYGVCGTMASLIDKNSKIFGKLILKSSDIDIRKKILFTNQFIHSSVLYRKSVVENLGGYSNYSVGEDYDLFLKIGLVNKFFNFSERMIGYRKHPEGITSQKKIIASRDYLNILKKYKKKYPCYFLAISKAYLRIILSYL